MGAIAMLKGPMEFVSTRLTSTELPFTVLYGVALLGTLYGAGLAPFLCLTWPWLCCLPGPPFLSLPFSVTAAASTPPLESRQLTLTLRVRGVQGR